MGAWTVDADAERNRLYVDISGTLTAGESGRATGALVSGVARLEEGFDAVIDLRGYQPGGAEGALERGERAMRQHDCAAAVRVMPPSASVSARFERIGGDEAAYPVAEAESVEQAETLLDERRSDGTR